MKEHPPTRACAVLVLLVGGSGRAGEEKCRS